MIIVKLGGSVITDKTRPLTARPRAIAALAGAVARLGEPLVAVHGGGSFGHYWSVRHDMHTRPAVHDPAAVAAVKNSMVDLNAIVLRGMAARGIATYAVPPHALVGPGGAGRGAALREVGSIAESGLVPVTYGDALWRRGGKTYILSGDSLAAMLAARLRPRLVIFATNVDGLYSDMRTRRLIRRIGPGEARELSGARGGRGRAATAAAAGRPPGAAAAAAAAAGPDATGGIWRKVRESSRIAMSGISAALVNGNKPGRVLDAAAAAGGRRRFVGTLIEGRAGR